DKTKLNLKPLFSNEEDYKRLLSSLAEYENNSSNAFATLMYKIKLYYNSYLRYNVRFSFYISFKLSVFAKLDILKNEILSLNL
ncbi:MAG: N-acetylmuramoyl-L-alanine amidase, partial [Wolbachia sp.]